MGLPEGKLRVHVMFLESIYAGNVDEAYSYLYQLLMEREDHESISHNDMPTWKEHEQFIDRRPYKSWSLIHIDVTTVVGSIYLTHKNEIGVHIFKKYRRNGYGEAAIRELIKTHLERSFYANINPVNQKSIDLFTKLEFTHIQNTYKLERKTDAGA